MRSFDGLIKGKTKVNVKLLVICPRTLLNKSDCLGKQSAIRANECGRSTCPGKLEKMYDKSRFDKSHAAVEGQIQA